MTSLGDQPWTTPADVQARWIGDEIPADDDLLAELIADVEDLILAEFPDLAERVESGQITPRRITLTTVLVIHRHLRNPDGIRTQAESTGPFNVSRTYGGDEPGALALTDDDRRRLLGRRAGQRAFTVTPGPAAGTQNPLAGAWVNGPARLAPGGDDQL